MHRHDSPGLTVVSTPALQLIAFFYVNWFIYKLEHGHRRAFLLQYQIDPDTCGFSHATSFDIAFLISNVLVVTGTMTNELLDLYEYDGTSRATAACSPLGRQLGQQLAANCTA